MSDEFILLARAIMGAPFVIWGAMKLRGGDAALVPVLSALGMPDAKALAYLVGLCEFVGGVCVILGYPLATVCILLGLWCVVTALVAHRNDVNQMLAHITMCGGFFALAALGPGSIALFGGQPSGIWALLP
ncbi:DoxX family protein [Mesorhizobium denitrificans]|uniref:DoxX family protein n=2 Tax=Mesorhizobium TaxID=68287 RepID=A0A371XCS9_9HYPH|nr:DoxX family protein [Mesorhizobium denitrificans]RFC67030.1 DoxX family protein [Mesorhizobium denitrificans]